MKPLCKTAYTIQDSACFMVIKHEVMNVCRFSLRLSTITVALACERLKGDGFVRRRSRSLAEDGPVLSP